MIQKHLKKIYILYDIYNNINYYNPTKNRKIVIVFDDMIADVMTNKKFQAIIKYIFFKCREMNISLAFITQDYFSVPIEVRLNTTLYLKIKNYNNREKKNIASNHSSDYKHFMKMCKKYTSEPYFF